MSGRLVRMAMVAAAAAIACAAPAGAQVLGPFQWQMQPYCNVVTLALTTAPAGGFVVDGSDDQCGAVNRASAVGIGTFNQSGNVTLNFSIVTAPNGTPVHVSAIVSPANGAGTWSDSAGHSGALAFFANTGGPPRPVDLVAFRVEGFASALALASTVRTDLTNWNIVRFNSGGGTYTPATGTYTVPASGLYAISAIALTSTVGSPAPGTYRFIGVEVNGALAQQVADQAADTFQHLQISCIRRLEAGDVVNISVLHNLGPGVTAAATVSDSHFAVVQLR